MKLGDPYLYFLIFVGLTSSTIAQRFHSNFGVMGKLEMTLGNQNQKIEAGIFALGAVGFGDASLEGGFSLISGPLFKRHLQPNTGWFYGYEFFMLGGIGKNTNLMGSASSAFHTALIFDPEGQGGFHGIGFGFQNEFLPHPLSVFNNRKGKLLLRFSNANHTLQLNFVNDVKLGRIFNGQGTDYGATGSLSIGYSHLRNLHEAWRIQARLALFTPKPDYALTPNNPINADDGRKNVWYTLAPFDHLFYANLSISGGYQWQDAAALIHLGVNSQKLGAYVQNTLHDGPGLNPRFPWNVNTKDKLFFEASGNLLKMKKNEH